METIEIYGASDDLVEVEGKLGDEWGGGAAPAHVVLSTEDRFTVTWDIHGVWRVEHVHDTGRLTAVLVRAEDEHSDPECRTDKMTVVGNFEWVDCWSSWPPEHEEVSERLQDRLDDLKGDRLMDAYNAARGR